MTDLYPHIDAFERMKNKFDIVDYVPYSVDARDVPEELSGLRTLFLSFHHFKEDDAVKILQNAIDTNNPIAIFETQDRSLQSIILMLLSPSSVLFTTLFIRPFKWQRILFTYLIPIVPLFVLWDGIVSSLRTYSVGEMKEMVQQLRGAEQYEWQIDKLKSGQAKITYLVAMPQYESNREKSS